MIIDSEQTGDNFAMSSSPSISVCRPFTFVSKSKVLNILNLGKYFSLFPLENWYPERERESERERENNQNAHRHHCQQCAIFLRLFSWFLVAVLQQQQQQKRIFALFFCCWNFYKFFSRLIFKPLSWNLSVMCLHFVWAFWSLENSLCTATEN